jgi:hypothetical protein
MTAPQRVGLLLIGVLALLGVGTPAFAAPATRTVEIVTVPPTPAARFLLDGVPLQTDGRGIVRTAVPRSSDGHRIELTTPTIETPDATREFVRWSGHNDSDQGYTPVLDGLRVDHTLRLRVAFRESRTVAFTFVDQAHHKVDPGRIESITIRDDAGRSQSISPTQAVHLTATRPTIGESQVVARDSTYSVQSVKIDGADVVNVGEQRFRPIQTGGQVEVVVLLRSVHFQVQDRLLSTPISTVVHLLYPNGVSEAHPTDANGELAIDNLARGTYTVSADGQVVAMDQELALSRSQFVTIYVLSNTDAVIIGAALLMLVVGLLGLGRWRSQQLPVDPVALAMAAIAAGQPHTVHDGSEDVPAPREDSDAVDETPTVADESTTEAASVATAGAPPGSGANAPEPS